MATIQRHKIIQSKEAVRHTIYTSYFAKIARDGRVEDKCFSVSRSSPPGFNGIRYKVLAPSEGLLCLWKNISDYGWVRFAENYRKETLSKLDPQKVFETIGEDSILVCWEGPGKFCHRHIIGEWLMENIKGLEVIEL